MTLLQLFDHLLEFYSPDEARDDHGQWSGGGGGEWKATVGETMRGMKGRHAGPERPAPGHPDKAIQKVIDDAMIETAKKADAESGDTRNEQRAREDIIAREHEVGVDEHMDAANKLAKDRQEASDKQAADSLKAWHDYIAKSSTPEQRVQEAAEREARAAAAANDHSKKWKGGDGGGDRSKDYVYVPRGNRGLSTLLDSLIEFHSHGSQE